MNVSITAHSETTVMERETEGKNYEYDQLEFFAIMIFLLISASMSANLPCKTVQLMTSEAKLSYINIVKRTSAYKNSKRVQKVIILQFFQCKSVLSICNFLSF